MQFTSLGKNILRVRIPDGGRDGETTIVARALPLLTYYRMAATVHDGQFFTLPLSDVIIPANITEAEIGLVAYRGDAILPLEPVAAQTDDRSLFPVMTFRAPFDVEKFLWRTDDPSGQKWNNVVSDEPVRSGGLIRFQLDGVKSKTAQLQLAIKPSNGDWMRPAMKIYVP